MDKRHAVKVLRQYVSYARLPRAVREMSARFPVFQRKGGETKAHYLNGLKLALKEVQVQKDCSSIHVGREPEIELTRLGFHNNIPHK